MILVSGAAGKTGLAVMAALSHRGEKVRALVKNEAQASRARAAGAMEVVCGDMLEEAAWQEALLDIDALYHIGPNMHPQEEQMGRLAVQAAHKAAVMHFVYHSVLHPQTEAMPHHWRKLRVEEAVLASGLPFTILQPTAYMQNILGGWDLVIKSGVYRVPYPVSTRLSLVHLADVAQAAAVALTEPGHAGATYELVGTPPLAQTEVAARLGEALGRDVTAEEIGLDEWRRQAEQGGLSGETLEILLHMFRYYASYGFAGNPHVLTWLLGRAPRTLLDFVAGAAASA